MFAIERKVDVSIASKHYSTVTKVEGDERISRSLLYEMFTFLYLHSFDKDGYDSDGNIKKWQYCKLGEKRDIKESCDKGIHLIKTHLQLYVVDSKVNYHEETNLNKFTWERTVNLEERSTVLCLTDRQFEYLSANANGTLKILTICKSSYRALKRFRKTLEVRAREEARAREAIREEKARRAKARKRAEDVSPSWDSYKDEAYYRDKLQKQAYLERRGKEIHQEFLRTKQGRAYSALPRLDTTKISKTYERDCEKQEKIWAKWAHKNHPEIYNESGYRHGYSPTRFAEDEAMQKCCVLY